MPFDDYLRTTSWSRPPRFAIAVFGLTVVLGLCGQINLAQAAFFGFGAYAVGYGYRPTYHINFWVTAW